VINVDIFNKLFMKKIIIIIIIQYIINSLHFLAIQDLFNILKSSKAGPGKYTSSSIKL